MTSSTNTQWALDRELLLPAAVIVSLFLPWITLTGFVTVTVTGVQLGAGWEILLAAVGLVALWMFDDGKHRIRGWLGGGTLMAVAGAYPLLRAQVAMQGYQTPAAGMLETDISVGYGIGAALFAIATLGILYVGHREKGRTEVESTEEGTLADGARES